MKNRMQLISSAVTLGLVAVLLIFSMAVHFGTFAWFASVDEVTATGIAVSADYDNTIKSVKYYRVTGLQIDQDENNEKHNIYSFCYDESVLAEQAERDSFETSVRMLPYSELSGDCQVLIEVELGAEDAVTLSVETLTAEYLGNIIRNRIQNGPFDLEPSGLALTSVLRFAVFNSLQIDAQSSSYLVSEDDVNATEYSFLTITADANGNLSYSFTNPLQDGIAVNPSGGKFYIFTDYYLPAVEDINELIVSYVDAAEAVDPNYDTILLGETNLVFTADFKFKVTKGAQ